VAVSREPVLIDDDDEMFSNIMEEFEQVGVITAITH
jgi:hypothetical protein